MKYCRCGKGLVVAALIVVFAFFATAGSAAAWAPSKPVEFVVPVGPGGASDVLARTITSIVETEKLAPVHFVVVNKSGGSGTVGMVYVVQQKQNPHVLSTYQSGQIFSPYVAGIESVTAKNFTHILAFAIDEQVLVVRADSPFKSVKDMVAAAKERPGTLTVGGTTIGADDHMCNHVLEKAAGIKLRYGSYNSGGEEVTALLGGHIDMIWVNPSEFSPQYEAKQVRPLGVAREERLPYMQTVPTFKEQGYNLTWRMFRSVAAPAGIPPEAAAYYENMLRKVVDSPRWKEGYLKRYMLTPTLMNGQELTRYIGELEQTSKGMLKEMGLLKEFK